MKLIEKKLFRDMVGELCQAGAQISIYQNGEMISMEILYNWLGTLDEISEEVEWDIHRELRYGRFQFMELLHPYNYPDKDVYSAHRRSEEVSVEFSSQQICIEPKLILG